MKQLPGSKGFRVEGLWDIERFLGCLRGLQGGAPVANSGLISS